MDKLRLNRYIRPHSFFFLTLWKFGVMKCGHFVVSAYKIFKKNNTLRYDNFVLITQRSEVRILPPLQS